MPPENQIQINDLQNKIKDLQKQIDILKNIEKEKIIECKEFKELHILTKKLFKKWIDYKIMVPIKGSAMFDFNLCSKNKIFLSFREDDESDIDYSLFDEKKKTIIEKHQSVIQEYGEKFKELTERFNISDEDLCSLLRN